MPFKKTTGGKYRGPSGRKFSKKQVAMYYARGGTFAKPKRRGKK